MYCCISQSNAIRNGTKFIIQMRNNSDVGRIYWMAFEFNIVAWDGGDWYEQKRLLLKFIKNSTPIQVVMVLSQLSYPQHRMQCTYQWSILQYSTNFVFFMLLHRYSHSIYTIMCHIETQRKEIQCNAMQCNIQYNKSYQATFIHSNSFSIENVLSYHLMRFAFFIVFFSFLFEKNSCSQTHQRARLQSLLQTKNDLFHTMEHAENVRFFLYDIYIIHIDRPMQKKNVLARIHWHLSQLLICLFVRAQRCTVKKWFRTAHTKRRAKERTNG